jgi:hypothetical protein
MPIRRHDVHVCLVSEQATPNFIPVLDTRFRPREVILVVSPQMQERARWLREALARRVERVTEHVLEDAWDIPRIHEALLNLVTQREGTDLALNVTGGTKPMAIAAQQVFHAEKLPIFYVHPARNQVVPLFVGDPPFGIEERVGLSDYLAIHGYREKSRDRREYPERHTLLAEEFVKEVERFAQPLRTLNWLVGRAKDTLRVALERHANDPRLGELLDKLERYGVARIERQALVFPDEAARSFANGGWLELHIARVLGDCANELGVQDQAQSLIVESAGGAPNELDVPFLAHNRLFLVECKTKRLAGPEAEGPGAESLYKLDSLTALGGLNTRGMLASYQPLERWDRQRAADLRIRIVEAAQLRNLAKHLRDWVTAP